MSDETATTPRVNAIVVSGLQRELQAAEADCRAAIRAVSPIMSAAWLPAGWEYRDVTNPRQHIAEHIAKLQAAAARYDAVKCELALAKAGRVV